MAITKRKSSRSPIHPRLLNYFSASSRLLLWLIIKTVAQAAVVLELARELGAEKYGLFVEVLAVASIFAPIAGLGLSSVLLRDGARHPKSLPELFGLALKLWVPSAALVSVGAILVTIWVLPASFPHHAVAVLVISEVFSSSFVEMAGRVEQSQNRIHSYGFITAGLPLIRLLILFIYINFHTANVVEWMWISSLCSMGYAAIIAGCMRKLQLYIRPKRHNWALAREGLPFTVGALSHRLQVEFNKPVLGQVGVAQAGIFNVAQKIVDLASLPLLALQEAFWPRLYANNKSFERTNLIAVALILISLLGGYMLSLAAPYLPYLLGPGYQAEVELLPLLAWLPSFYLMRNLLHAQIVAKRQQSLLTLVYLVGGSAGVGFNLWLIPLYGLKGAVVAAYLVEISTIVTLIYRLRQAKTLNDKFPETRL